MPLRVPRRVATLSWSLLLLLLLGATPVLAKRRSRANRASTSAHSRKRECENGDCAGVHEDDRPNCVLRCQSEMCYNEVYMPEELEPGEIDMKRQRTFQTCLTKESRQISVDKMKRRREGTKSGGKTASEEEEEDDDDDEPPTAMPMAYPGDSQVEL